LPIAIAADWEQLSEPQQQRVRHAAFSLSKAGNAGMQQSTSTDGNLCGPLRFFAVFIMQLCGPLWYLVIPFSHHQLISNP